MALGASNVSALGQNTNPFLQNLGSLGNINPYAAQFGLSQDFSNFFSGMQGVDPSQVLLLQNILGNRQVVNPSASVDSLRRLREAIQNRLGNEADPKKKEMGSLLSKLLPMLMQMMQRNNRNTNAPRPTEAPRTNTPAPAPASGGTPSASGGSGTPAATPAPTTRPATPTPTPAATPAPTPRPSTPAPTVAPTPTPTARPAYERLDSDISRYAQGASIARDGKNDFVRLTGSDGSLANVSLGGGRNVFRLETEDSRVGNITSGNAHDRIGIFGENNLIDKIDTGKGDDIVNIAGKDNHVDLIDTGDGKDRVYVQGGNRVDEIKTGAGDDQVFLYANSDVGKVELGDGNDRIDIGYSNTKDDTPERTIISGGAGIDTVVFHGRAEDFTIANNEDGSRLYTNNGSGDSWQVGADVENVEFSSEPMPEAPPITEEAAVIEPPAADAPAE